MRKSLVLVAFSGAIVAPLVACSSEQPNGNGESTDSSGTTSGGTVSPSSTSTGGNSGTTSTGGTTATSNNPTSTGGSGSSSTTGGGSGSAGSSSSTTTAPTSGGSGSSGTTSNAGGSSSTGGSDPTDTSGETSGETSGPMGPPDGAYVACSGDAFPNVTLTPFLTSPKVQLPIDMDMPPGQPNMVYVTERGGALKRFDMSQDNPMATTILEVTTSTGSECGFFGVAFHPNFDGDAEKRMYVSYMPTCPANIFGAGGSSTLDEYEVTGDTATKTATVFDIDQPQGNHNGGNVAFGPDGYLYYSLGDGGNSDDQGSGHSSNGNGQDVTEPLGSILRFDVDALETPPAGNLTSEDVGGMAGVDGRILHYGLRNPWRFTFDRATDDLYIGDVGQNTREEVDMLPAGSGPTNFGWAAREGKGAHPTGDFTLVGGTTAMEPIHDYATDPGGGGTFKGSVTGGYVYRGQKIPGMYGRYIFADYVRGDIFAVTADGEGGACDATDVPNNEIAGNSLASFAEDNEGELYAIGLSDGIFKFEPAQ